MNDKMNAFLFIMLFLMNIKLIHIKIPVYMPIISDS